jgi:hypothetical protein
MILLAGFAALSWSRTARDGAGPPGPLAFATAVVLLLAAFFTLRVADEHKDAANDRVARPELPVPRGLVTLGELRWAASPLVLLATVMALAISPRLLLPLGAAAIWLALMTREFFVPEWLRARPLPYLLSHMVILPLLLLAATAIDWLPTGAVPPGLGWFLAASYATGLVLELGRKIRAPSDERPGVDTYTSAWGVGTAVAAWLVALGASVATIAIATSAAGARAAPIATVAAGLVVAVPVLSFVAGDRATRSGAKVESASALWTLAAYGCLALPWVERALRTRP